MITANPKAIDEYGDLIVSTPSKPFFSEFNLVRAAAWSGFVLLVAAGVLTWWLQGATLWVSSIWVVGLCTEVVAFLLSLSTDDSDDAPPPFSAA